jgi:hypothetical protein
MSDPQTPEELGFIKVIAEEGFDLHHLPGTGPDAVVSFSGIGSQPGLEPRFEFIQSCSLGGSNHVIVVRDMRRTWYSKPGLVDAIHQSVRAFAEGLAIRHLLGVGNSMGGYGAILFAPLLGFRQTVAFVPQFSMHPDVVAEQRWRRWRRQLDGNLALGLTDALQNAPGETWIIHDSGGLDPLHIEKFPVLDNLHHLIVDKSSHGVAADFRAAGKLQPFMKAALAGDLAEVERVIADLSYVWRSPVAKANMDMSGAET